MMEPALRRLAATACGRCSASLRGQSIAYTSQLWRVGSTHHTRTLHSTPCNSSPNRSTSEANKSVRTFTSNAKLESEAPAFAPSTPADKPLRLAPDDLFHSFTSSPVPEFRRRAAFMRQHAYCPHPDHQHTRMPTVAPKVEDEAATAGEAPPAHVDFECPDCGVPVYCSKEHWMDDYENHLKVCDTLRQINEDDHDLRSGRVFQEAELPEHQLDDAMVNMTNWDTFMYTREFNAINSDQSMRQITRLLTYPITVGSVLHELSPYSLKAGERLTVEGLKSFSG